MAPKSRPKRARKTYTEEQKEQALKIYELEGPTAVRDQLGIPKSTVDRWRKKAGVRTVRNDRTRAMIEARTVDLKARRKELTALLLDDAHRLREQLWQPARLVNFGGKDNTLNETTLDEPLYADKKNIMSAVGIAVDRVVKLEAVDADEGLDQAVSMLDKLAEQLGGDLTNEPGRGGDESQTD